MSIRHSMWILFVLSLLPVAGFAESAPPNSSLSALSPAASQSGEAAIRLMLAREHFNATISAVQQQPDYQENPVWSELHAKALIGLQRYQDADAVLNTAIEQYPKYSNLYLLSALNQFALAEQAGLFSVGRHVKDGLASLQLAARLAPHDAEIQLKLLGFYLEAPGFIGGDIAKARQIAQDLQAAAPADAAIASSMLLQHDDKIAQALTVLAQQRQQTPEHVRLLVHQAGVLARDQQDLAALTVYLQAAELVEQAEQQYPAGLKQQYLYQAARSAAASVQSQTDNKPRLSAAQLVSAIAAAQQVIVFYQNGEGQSLHWARVKLAQLHMAQADLAAAQQQLTPLLALNAPQERLAQEIKKLQRQLKKQLKASVRAGS